MTNEQRLLPFFQELKEKLESGDTLLDRTGQRYVELIAPRIVLDPTQPLLNFGVRSTPISYAEAEIRWYRSQSLSVEEIGNHAKIWNAIASKDGKVNSNYGYIIWSPEYWSQYNHVRDELLERPDSRRTSMIYNRPSMWVDYNKDGMNDFICTFGTCHFIRNDKLEYVVQMRSNDAVFGFFNDFYWHCFVQTQLLTDLRSKYPSLKNGEMVWISASWHVYERHFELLKQIVQENK